MLYLQAVALSTFHSQCGRTDEWQVIFIDNLNLGVLGERHGKITAE